MKAPKMKPQNGRREQAHNRAVSGLVHAHHPRGGLSLHESIGGDTTLFFRQQENYISLSCTVGVLHVRWNPLNAQAAYHNTKTIKIVNIPNSPQLKIMATYASMKPVGLRVRGCGSFTTLRSTHTRHNINVRVEVLIRVPNQARAV